MMTDPLPVQEALPVAPLAPRLGPALKTWRLLRRVKQSHAAELLNISQATISRWESGLQEPVGPQAGRLAALMAARLDGAADAALAELVRHSHDAVHLVCDATHKLLAASPARAAAWKVGMDELAGTSLWRFASPEIVAAEAGLAKTHWFEPNAPAVEVFTGANDSEIVPIRPSRMRWTRMPLADGSFARLVQTLAA